MLVLNKVIFFRSEFQDLFVYILVRVELDWNRENWSGFMIFKKRFCREGLFIYISLIKLAFNGIFVLSSMAA
jgi:hypothetical protein